MNSGILCERHLLRLQFSLGLQTNELLLLLFKLLHILQTRFCFTQTVGLPTPIESLGFSHLVHARFEFELLRQRQRLEEAGAEEI